jgi:hypothetical protein
MMLSQEDMRRIEPCHSVQWAGSSMRAKRVIGEGEVLLCCYAEQPAAAAASAGGSSNGQLGVMGSSKPHGVGKTVW